MVIHSPDRLVLGMVECLTVVKMVVADYVIKIIFGSRIWISGSGIVTRLQLFTEFYPV